MGLARQDPTTGTSSTHGLSSARLHRRWPMALRMQDVPRPRSPCESHATSTRWSTVSYLEVMRTGLLLAVLPILLAATDARACKYPNNLPHSIDEAEAEIDDTPPGPLVAVDVGPLTRDVEGSCDECSSGTALELAITPPSDDRTAPGELGYVLELVAGELPFTLPEGPVRGPTIFFRTNDARTGHVSAVLAIRAVDRAGNVGPETRVEIDDQASGCRLAPLSGLTPVWLTIAVLPLLRRRPRRSA